jgi:S-adenosylmethionine synthetase
VDWGQQAVGGMGAMFNMLVEELNRTPVEDQRLELVERKGKGHPDSICDAIAEDVSVALCREYLAGTGRILHYNVDKGLLVAGRTQPRLKGGTVLEPMRLVLGDRATASYKGRHFKVDEIAESSAKDWMRRNLSHVDPDRHLIFQGELKEGSPELTDLFERETIGANDTSAAIGYAPLTETENLVLAAERYLNSIEFKRRFPEAGEDVKIMGCRRDRQLLLTVAIAFVDRFVSDPRTYFSRKEEMRLTLEGYLAQQQQGLDRIGVNLNTLDDPARGERGMYLTVLGTSAEGGDCGEVGRGNSVNGVISMSRPMGGEAAAGKNPVSHVGKIYSVLSHQLAAKIYADIPGLQEVYVLLCSQIGQPVDRPMIASAQIITASGVDLEEVRAGIENIVRNGLAATPALGIQLARGEWPLC